MPLTVLPATVAVAPPLALKIVTELRFAGTTSVKVAFVTGLGPAFLIVSVKVTVWPTATLGFTLALVNERSALPVTGSASRAVHTPFVHEGLVLTTPRGDATRATFCTAVWP